MQSSVTSLKLDFTSSQLQSALQKFNEFEEEVERLNAELDGLYDKANVLISAVEINTLSVTGLNTLIAQKHHTLDSAQKALEEQRLETDKLELAYSLARAEDNYVLKKKEKTQQQLQAWVWKKMDEESTELFRLRKEQK